MVRAMAGFKTRAMAGFKTRAVAGFKTRAVAGFKTRAMAGFKIRQWLAKWARPFHESRKGLEASLNNLCFSSRVLLEPFRFQCGISHMTASKANQKLVFIT